MSRQRPPVIPPREKGLNARIHSKESPQKSALFSEIQNIFPGYCWNIPFKKMCNPWIKTVGFPASFFSYSAEAIDKKQEFWVE